MVDVKDILNRYGSKIEQQINGRPQQSNSQEYMTFREEMIKTHGSYEKWCKSLGSFFRLKVSDKEAAKIKGSIDIAHLDLEPWQALGLSLMAFLGIFLIGLLSSLAVLLIGGTFPFLYFILSLFLGIFVFYFSKGYPARLANKWRLKASSQMVPAILYIVVYMRHTANLEKAISFAAEHLEYPLSLDFKKVFYNVEIGKFSTIKESLDNYLETWKGYSSEFIESFHMIEASLFEPDNNRRIGLLEKGLQVVLDGVYDKMLRYTHGVRSPITNVYMLGVVLPTLGLALLPLASAMVGDILKWYHVIILFNLIVPFFVFYLTDKVMFMRPGGYGETDILESNPLYYEYKSKKPYFVAGLICLPLIILGLIPLVFQIDFLRNGLGLPMDISFADIGLGFLGSDNIFGTLQNSTGSTVGPFGAGALILSLFFVLGIALFFSIVYKAKTKNLIKEREKTKELENEFNNSLFQLGNRIGNGTPPELAFGLVAESTQGLNTEDFFRKVNYNVRQMGMSVEKAIFDPRRGALIHFPSQLIATSMRILIESSKKGLKIAASSLMSISEYVKNIHKITDRLRDVLSETVSDMRSNMTFLAPLLSGVVIGLASMITVILGKLQSIGDLEGISGVAGGFASFLGPDGIFQITKIIPPYYLQISIGIYLIEIIFILTSTLVTIDAGEDSLYRINETGKNIKRGILLYIITAFVTTIALFLMANIVLGGLVAG